MLAVLDSNQGSRIQSPVGCRYPNGHREPFPGAAPGELSLQGTAGRWPGGQSTLGGARTRNLQHLMLTPLPKLGYERAEPLLGADPSYLSVRRTGGRWPERQSCRTRTRTSIRDFRGRCPAIRRSGIGTGGGIRTRSWARFELVASACWATPACAARGSNPEPPH